MVLYYRIHGLFKAFAKIGTDTYFPGTGNGNRCLSLFFTQYFNKKIHAAGHLLQGRYYSCVLDDQHLLAAARYIERNPVRIKLVKTPTDYVWSSAKNHAAISHNDIIDTNDLFKYIEVEQCGWKAFVDKSDEPNEVSNVRKHTLTGRPLGNTAFIQKLEKTFGERIRALPVGRPKTTSNEK